MPSRDIYKDFGISWQTILTMLSRLSQQQDWQQQAEFDGRVRAVFEASSSGNGDANIPSIPTTPLETMAPLFEAPRQGPSVPGSRKPQGRTSGMHT